MVWVPVTQADRELVFSHLAAILQSQPFRHSKRYPALLAHCVQYSLDGDLDKLRERRLGVELFGRGAEYDTGVDPIVRVTAAEVRRRLAQFYDGEGAESQLLLELPTGSYVVRFSHDGQPNSSVVPKAEPVELITVERQAELHGTSGQLTTADVPNPITESSTEKSFSLWLLAFAVVIATLVAAWFWRSKKVSPLWDGISNAAGGQTTLVLGQLPSAAQSSGDEPLNGNIFSAGDSVSVEGASSAVNLCSALARLGGNCRVREAANIDLSDLQGRSSILVGAYNDPWALRITGALPYKFGPLACKCIVESRTGETLGTVDFSLPRSKVAVDYSVIARFHSEVTDGPVMVVAGVAPMSTQAAAEFVTSPDRIDEALRYAPRSWRGQNVEVVLATEIVNGVPGHTKIVRTAFW